MNEKNKESTRLIALAGFAADERAALKACLKNSWFQNSGYSITNQLHNASIVIGNADEASVLRVLRARPGGPMVVLIGGSDGGTGWPVVPRRFQASQLAQMLDAGIAEVEETGRASSDGPALMPTAPGADRGTGVELASANLPGWNVLLVDESELGIRKSVRQLGELRVAVKVARSGTHALEMLPAEPFSHVLLDVMVSGMNGFRICREIKELVLPAGYIPRVILMTSISGEAGEARARLSGCDDFLVKPVTPAQLSAALGLRARAGDSVH